MQKKIDRVQKLLKEIECATYTGTVLTDAQAEQLASCKEEFSRIRANDIYNERHQSRRKLQELRAKWHISVARCSQIYKDIVTNTNGFYRKKNRQ